MDLKSYVIVGAGMQGTAAAYDLSRFGQAREILLVDGSVERAEGAATRVNRLAGQAVCRAAAADASNRHQLSKSLVGADVVLSCVPYKLHEEVEEAALLAGASVIDMGNDTDVTLRTLAREDEFKAKNITLVPDTGLAPGLVNSIGAWFVRELDGVETIKLYCGGLPQRPVPPFDYTLRFSVEGLLGEYVDEAIALREHQVLRLPTLAELETVTVPGFGTLEAFTTSSGTSTAPYTFQEKVRNYEYKTLRYPGHCRIMQAFQVAGFWGDDPVAVDGVEVVPSRLFCKLVGEHLFAPDDPDVVIVYATAEGRKAGREVRYETTIVDRFDTLTGFTAMERMTGFSTAIIAAEVAHGSVRTGCVRYEDAVPGSKVLDELQRRGIVVETRVTEIGSV